MLGKLFKHEFKETAKLLVPLNLILIALTIIGAILLGTSILQNESLEILAVSSMMVYILSIIALFIITAVYLTIRFYKTMYSSQGYLTHTLPVSTASVINTKILVSAFWIFISFCITILSVFVLIRITAGTEWDPSVFQELNAVIPELFGIGAGEFLVLLIATLILACFSGILMIFASLSIGQLFSLHRIIAAIITYIVFYVIEQIIGTIELMILGISNADSLLAAEEDVIAIGAFYRGTLASGIIQSAIFCILFYIICHYVTRKRLNLE